MPSSSLNNCIGTALLAEGSSASMPNIRFLSEPGADVGYVICSNFFVLQARKLFPQLWGGNGDMKSSLHAFIGGRISAVLKTLSQK